MKLPIALLALLATPTASNEVPVSPAASAVVVPSDAMAEDAPEQTQPAPEADPAPEASPNEKARPKPQPRPKPHPKPTPQPKPVPDSCPACGMG